MPQNDSEILKLSQVCRRYGLSSREVFRYLMPEGLPMYRRQGQWFADLQNLKKWELETKRVYFGKTEYESMVLPAYASILLQRRRQQRRAELNKARVWRQENRHLYQLFYIMIGIFIGMAMISAIVTP